MLSRDFSWQDVWFFQPILNPGQGTCNPHSGAKFSPSSGLSPLEGFSFNAFFSVPINIWRSPIPQFWKQMVWKNSGMPQQNVKQTEVEWSWHSSGDWHALFKILQFTWDAVYPSQDAVKFRIHEPKHVKILVMTATFSGVHPDKSRCKAIAQLLRNSWVELPICIYMCV